MGILGFILRLFKIKPGWNGTPEMFLAMVLYIQKKNSAEYFRQETLQWGEIMQKMIKVNLAPYRDFADLLDHGTPDYSKVSQVDKKMTELHQRVELKKAIYGEKADLGDDDVMTSNDESAILARKFVKDLSKHVDFPDGEIDKLKDL